MKSYYAELNYLDESNKSHSLWYGDIEANNKREVVQEVIDKHWDRRLESASCSPDIYIEEIEDDY